MKRMPHERRALAIGLYDNGFTSVEISQETGYSVATVGGIIRATGTAQVGSAARLEQGLRNFVQYSNSQG